MQPEDTAAAACKPIYSFSTQLDTEIVLKT